MRLKIVCSLLSFVSAASPIFLTSCGSKHVPEHTDIIFTENINDFDSSYYDHGVNLDLTGKITFENNVVIEKLDRLTLSLVDQGNNKLDPIFYHYSFSEQHFQLLSKTEYQINDVRIQAQYILNDGTLLIGHSNLFNINITKTPEPYVPIYTDIRQFINDRTFMFTSYTYKRGKPSLGAGTYCLFYHETNNNITNNSDYCYYALTNLHVTDGYWRNLINNKDAEKKHVLFTFNNNYDDQEIVSYFPSVAGYHLDNWQPHEWNSLVQNPTNDQSENFQVLYCDYWTSSYYQRNRYNDLAIVKINFTNQQVNDSPVLKQRLDRVNAYANRFNNFAIQFDLNEIPDNITLSSGGYPWQIGAGSFIYQDGFHYQDPVQNITAQKFSNWTRWNKQFNGGDQPYGPNGELLPSGDVSQQSVFFTMAPDAKWGRGASGSVGYHILGNDEREWLAFGLYDGTDNTETNTQHWYSTWFFNNNHDEIKPWQYFLNDKLEYINNPHANYRGN
ncbi:MAG: hypothetical protein L3I91_00160 [Mycoplasma sp.]